MPSWEETQQDWRSPGLEEIWDSVNKEVNAAVPNPMRPLKNAFDPIEIGQRALEIPMAPFAGVYAMLRGVGNAVNPSAVTELEKSMNALAPLAIGRGAAAGARTPTLAEAKSGMKLATEGGAPGYVRVGPSAVQTTDEGLKMLAKNVPGADQLILRSNQLYGLKSATDAEAQMMYEPYVGDKWKNVAGWNESAFSSPTSPGGGPPQKIGNWSRYVEGYNNPELVAHEMAHGILRSDTKTGVNTQVPGLSFDADRANQIGAVGLYGTDVQKGRELLSNLAEERGVTITDPQAFWKWHEENIMKNPQMKNEPLYLVDPSLEGKPGPVLSREEWGAQEAKKARYAEQNRAKEEANAQYRLNKSRQAMKRSAQSDLPFSDVERPKKGTPEWQAKMDKLQAEIDAEESTRLKGISESFGLDLNKLEHAPPFSDAATGDMEKAFNYALRQYTPMHTDSPVVKEAKQQRLRSFMDWWQRSDDTARRDFVKALPKEEQPRVQPRSSSIPAQPLSQPYAEDQLMSERERLKQLHTRLRSQSGKLRGVR